MDENSLYLKEFQEWLVEQSNRIQDLKDCIKNAEAIKESNEKQLELLLQRINLNIENHNKWAEREGYPITPLVIA